MQYRTRLLIVLLGVTLLTNGISLAVLHGMSEHYLREAYRATLLSITESIAAMLEAPLLQQAQSGQDLNAPEYQRLRQILRRARDANRRPNAYMKRVFTVTREMRGIISGPALVWILTVWRSAGLSQLSIRMPGPLPGELQTFPEKSLPARKERLLLPGPGEPPRSRTALPNPV